MGKTAFCMGIAQNVVTNREKPGTVAVFSLEMFARRAGPARALLVAGVSVQEVRKGTLRDNDCSA